MTLLKVAILEDDKEFLKEMIDNLKRTGLVKIVVSERKSEEFIGKVKVEKPDLLLLDIVLNNDIRDGFDVFLILKIPCIFLTGKKSKFFEKIDTLKQNKNFPPVDVFGKIPDQETLHTIITKFKPSLKDFQKSQKIEIKPKGESVQTINPNEVSFILASDGDHTIYFSNEKPIEVADKSFKYFMSNGFPESTFTKIKRNYLLNNEKTVLESKKLCIKYCYDQNTIKTEKIDVSNYSSKELKELSEKFNK